VLVAFLFDNHTAHAMTESMTLFSAASLIIYWVVVRPAERSNFESSGATSILEEADFSP